MAAVQVEGKRLYNVYVNPLKLDYTRTKKEVKLNRTTVKIRKLCVSKRRVFSTPFIALTLFAP